MTDKLGQLFGIEGSGERDRTLATIDKMFGIKGARLPEEPPREMNQGETIDGEIVDVKFGDDKQAYYIVENDKGDRVMVPYVADMAFEKGDAIEATRTEQGYEISDDRGMER